MLRMHVNKTFLAMLLSKIKGHPTRRQVIWSLCSDPLLGRDEVTRTNRGAKGIGGRVKFLPLAWAGMPKTSFRKNSDSPLF